MMPVIKRYLKPGELKRLEAEQESEKQFEVGLNKPQKDFTKTEKDILKVFKDQENRL